MSDLRILFGKVESLPLEVQRQVADFLEFLVVKYNPEQEIGDEKMDLLEQRMQEMQAHPERNRSWEDVRKSIHQKFGWE